MGTCDKCGALAYVRVTLDTGLDLEWCAHHAREYEEALTPYVIHQVDMRHVLADA